MRWWVSRTGQPEGPFTQEQIAGEIRAGRLTSSAHVAPENGGAWQPITAVPELARAFDAPAAPPTPATPPSAPQGPKVAATMAMDASQFAALSAANAPPSAQGSMSGPGSMAGLTPAPPGPIGGAPMGSSPGAPMAAVASGPAAFGQATPKKKSSLPLLVGAGCGFFALIGLCGVAGAGYYAWSASQDPFADRALELTEVVRAVALNGSHDDASTWGDSAGGDDLLDTPAEARATLAQLGSDPEVLFTVVEVKACDGPVRVSGGAVVFPDGRVRFQRAGAYHFEELGCSDGWPGGVPESQQDLLRGVDLLVDSVAESCTAEWVTSDDVEGLPPDIASELTRRANDEDLREECHRVRADASWQRSIDEFVIIVRGNGQNATIHTRFRRSANGRNYLEPIRVRIMEPRGA